MPDKPLDNLRTSFDGAIKIVSLLAEGVGVRAIERLAGVHRDTVLNVLEVAGQKCARLMDQRVRNHPFEFVQIDELFAFVHCKEANNKTKSDDIGEQYTYLGTDADSKFIINFTIGKRNGPTTQKYIQDLTLRVKTPFQLSSDAFKSYRAEVYYGFQDRVHYGQVVKSFANKNEGAFTERKYSPSPCTGVRKIRWYGNPSWDKISTSYAERCNLSVRLFNRRFTRLTLGYSKKLENLKHSMALFIAHFNFCRVHSALKIKATLTEPAQERTPAMACGLADHAWSVEELLKSI